MNSFSMTDQGKRRSSNQDRHASYCDDRFSLLIVADGLGGHRAGEVASQLAVDAVCAYFAKSQSRDDFMELLREAVFHANQVVYQAAIDEPEYQGMGTTLVTFLLVDDVIYFAHVGDSRAYRLRNKSLEQLTEDHSLVEDLIRRGLLSREDALSHPERNVVTRAVGTQTTVEVDCFSVIPEDGDRYLLCSDGLTAMVSDERICEILDNPVSLESVCQNLIDEANENGGYDNITVAVFEYRS